MNISVKGIDHAIKTIEKYADLDRKLQEIAKRLCEIGEPIIRQIHGHHADYIGTVPTESGYKIVCEGEDVLFIEFGAGNAAGRESGNYDAVPAVVYPGSWSETHARQYVMYGNWWFGGQAYTEVPPSPALYYAYEYMVQNFDRIAKEVFR